MALYRVPSGPQQPAQSQDDVNAGRGVGARFCVLSAEFAHETNTFSIVPTGFNRFVAQDCFLDAASAIATRGDFNTELAGFLGTARARLATGSRSERHRATGRPCHA